MRYVTRTSALEYEDFNAAKSRLIERAEKFGEISLKVWIRIVGTVTILVLVFLVYEKKKSTSGTKWVGINIYFQARRTIAMLSQDFIFDGCAILVHGFSRVVLEVLKTAASSGKLFRVFCTGLFCISILNFYNRHFIFNFFFFLWDCLFICLFYASITTTKNTALTFKKSTHFYCVLCFINQMWHIDEICAQSHLPMLIGSIVDWCGGSHLCCIQIPNSSYTPSPWFRNARWQKFWLELNS